MKENTAKIKYIASMVIFGTIGIFKFYTDVPSSVTAFSRGLIGFLFLLIIYLIKGSKPDIKALKSNALLLLLSGAALGFNWIFLFESYKYTTVAVSTLCYYTAPIIVVIVSPLVFKDKLTFKKILCILQALVGVFLLSGVVKGSMPSISELRGIALGLLAAVVYALIVILNKKTVGVPTFDKTLVQLFTSAVIMGIYSAVTGGFAMTNYNTQNIIMLAVLGIVHTGLAYFLFFDGISGIKAQSAAMLSYADPAVAVTLSPIILGQSITVLEIIGAILIIFAAMISDFIFQFSP